MKTYRDLVLEVSEFIQEEQIDEVLKSSDPIEKWIEDFVKSDNPKFEGKTKEERSKMAMGAYYGAQKESKK